MENPQEILGEKGVAPDPLYDLPGQKAAEKPQHNMAQVPPTLESDLPAAEYSGAPSNDSNNSSDSRRRYQRGGRKKRQEEAEDESQFRGEVEVENNLNGFGGRKMPTMDTTLPHRDADEPFDTGIKTFNMKKADQSGGRTLGISLGEKSKTATKTKTKKAKAKAKTKSKNKVKCTKCGRKKKKNADEKEDWESEGEEENSSEEEEEEEKPKKKKPVSIRLDLNLELEIFLRAKIKGDVTITFL
ncbi:hypothetical protein G7Y89_g11969 [Cudoniella acicularis]|uniref:Uncharacterized protein n=1 Tax=Cudoniella acicularis TaxID=354080 RepID=A0A8H4R9X0_9HELO|nr:hypothetical protein G7Y89_g11969 [Cudoniella acicularis]